MTPMSSSAGSIDHGLPPVDSRLIAPESRYEVEDGRVVYVPPADEPHGTRHSKISALVEACAGTDYDVASDMLTRTSEVDDVAPDVSVFRAERDPETGGRRLEELAFEIVSTERLSHAGKKAQKLVSRGVRRVFAVDVARQRAFEWSVELGTWSLLPASAEIEDPALAAPLPVEALVREAKADDAVARALLAKQNGVIQSALRAQREAGHEEGREAGREEGRMEARFEAVLTLLHGRGLVPSEEERQRLLATREASELEALLVRAATCTSVADLLRSD